MPAWSHCYVWPRHEAYLCLWGHKGRQRLQQHLHFGHGHLEMASCGCKYCSSSKIKAQEGCQVLPECGIWCAHICTPADSFCCCCRLPELQSSCICQSQLCWKATGLAETRGCAYSEWSKVKKWLLQSAVSDEGGVWEGLCEQQREMASRSTWCYSQLRWMLRNRSFQIRELPWAQQISEQFRFCHVLAEGHVS